MFQNVLSIDMIKEIGKYCDDVSHYRLLKSSKYYYNNLNPAEQKALRTSLINAKYFEIKQQHSPYYLPVSGDLFPTYLVHKIDRCSVGFRDYWDAIAMYKATEKHIDRLEEWNNCYYKQDLYKVRSLIQGIRVALHIRGIEIPEPPCYEELPKELRLSEEEDSIENYYRNTVIKGRIRRLTNRYRINKINVDQIKNDYNILFV